MSVSWQSQLRWRSTKKTQRTLWALMHTCVYVCVCLSVLWPREYAYGGSYGGWGEGRISYRVQHNYWSLDTNNGRAKEDLVCVRTPLLLSCCPVVPVTSAWSKKLGCTLWGGPVHLEDWPVCLSCIAPHPHHIEAILGFELHAAATLVTI